MLIESMRDVGYSLETALADVIDNSITAGATEVSLLVDATSPHPKIGILDNGCGMDRVQLLEAMRLGSSNPRAKWCSPFRRRGLAEAARCLGKWTPA